MPPAQIPDLGLRIGAFACLHEVHARQQRVVQDVAGLDVIDLTPDNFPLPSLASRLDDLRAELVHGRGLHLFKGVPVHRYTPWQRCAVFYGMGAHMGWTCPQNARGHVLGHVKDLGTFLFILYNIVSSYGKRD